MERLYYELKPFALIGIGFYGVVNAHTSLVGWLSGLALLFGAALIGHARLRYRGHL